jgi:hypothetical protein
MPTKKKSAYYTPKTSPSKKKSAYYTPRTSPSRKKKSAYYTPKTSPSRKKKSARKSKVNPFGLLIKIKKRIRNPDASRAALQLLLNKKFPFKGPKNIKFNN